MDIEFTPDPLPADPAEEMPEAEAPDRIATLDQATAAAFDLGTVVRAFYKGLGDDMDPESASYLAGEYMQAQIALGSLAAHNERSDGWR